MFPELWMEEDNIDDPPIAEHPPALILNTVGQLQISTLTTTQHKKFP